ncbi:MAG: sirohydrochlorin chelatase [Methylococcales bacterium]|nr:sirohydrochlorin chelatase [Methylococcales bacterium]
MKTTVLLVGHGSRNQAGNAEIETFHQQWQAQHPDWHIELCFIELAPVLLPEGLNRAAKDAEKVIVVPLIISAAGHVKVEIPEFIAAARLQNPTVEFVYAPHLGSNETMLNILQKQLKSALKTLAMPDPKTTGIIVLGRGSSDKVANGELAKLTRWLFEETEHELVDMAFTGVAFPRLETTVQRQTQLGMTQIVVLPYYLFSGLLIDRIAAQMARLTTQYPHIAFASGTYFGFDADIFKLLDQRVLEAIDPNEPKILECDGCQYREHAHSHHH